MSETEEVTVLIDLDRMPRNIGYVRDHDAGRGTTIVECFHNLITRIFIIGYLKRLIP